MRGFRQFLMLTLTFALLTSGVLAVYCQFQMHFDRASYYIGIAVLIEVALFNTIREYNQEDLK